MSRRKPTKRHAVLVCVCVLLTALTCAALVTAAVLVPAPAVVLPILVPMCIGLPMLAAWELPPAILVLRRRRDILDVVDPSLLQGDPLGDLRRALEALPETSHPLDL